MIFWWRCRTEPIERLTHSYWSVCLYQNVSQIASASALLGAWACAFYTVLGPVCLSVNIVVTIPKQSSNTSIAYRKWNVHYDKYIYYKLLSHFKTLETSKCSIEYAYVWNILPTFATRFPNVTLWSNGNQGKVDFFWTELIVSQYLWLGNRIDRPTYFP